MRRHILAASIAAVLVLFAPAAGAAGGVGDELSPLVTIDKGPRKQSNKAQAKFIFTSDEAGSTFVCSVDGKTPKTCASPFTTRKLRPGKHTFGVRATDVAGNQSTEALYKWKIKK